MAVFEPLSRRLKRAASPLPADPLLYDALPDGFRAQVAHIWQDALGPYVVDRRRTSRVPSPTNDVWDWIANTAAREAGVIRLNERKWPNDECCEYLLNEPDVARVFDLIEISFVGMQTSLREAWEHDPEFLYGAIRQKLVHPEHAIEELNARFQQHNLGYQFSEARLIRLDSTYMHGEVVAPALTLLRDASFAGAEQEYGAAHEHYRHGRFKEAMNEALKAFESTMKTICDARGWAYDRGATAVKLIKVIFDNDLVPTSMRSHFDAVRTALESGLGTLRNKMSAHGQGAEVTTVPRFLAAHALHLAAANIVLLVEAHRAAA